MRTKPQKPDISATALARRGRDAIYDAEMPQLALSQPRAVTGGASTNAPRVVLEGIIGSLPFRRSEGR
jgi:hypothetical protein